ncbi:MAG: adenylate/guanylate cyclase domain-containing protein, partial [Burkholderiaceae bacterium]
MNTQSDDMNQWLELLGLDQYQAQFADNDIGIELLPDLTHDLLMQMGIASVGHRLRILKAAQPNPVNARVENPEPTVAVASAERRQLTVMFCDLIDSTVLSSRLDPEVLREVVRAYQQAAEREISRFDGYIAQYLGDGLLVYFGYPQAHENDPQRAVYAGLGVLDAIATLNDQLRRDYRVDLSVRIGIHTGPVVVGQMGGDLRRENLALGETPNLAARLEGLAKPNTVVISEMTRRLLGASFALRALGPQSLKGIAEDVLAFVVDGEHQNETRFSAAHSSDAGAIIGRDHEVSQLRDAWALAIAGQGQMVLLNGEAGIGKSRVVHALTDMVTSGHSPGDESAQAIRLTYQCSPYHSDTALYPAFTQLRRAAGIQPGDKSDEQLDKLETLLYKGTDDISLAAPLLGSMMGMGDAVHARYGDTDVSPNEQRTLALRVLSEQLFSLTKKCPVLFIIEDAHWIDPTTQALTELLLHTFTDHRVLLLVTARPGFEENYGDNARLTRIQLHRLSREQARKIISRLTHGKRFPDELADEILAKADGVPLFVEEITRTILESGRLIESSDAFEVSGSGGPMTVPSSLQDSLMARLDKLQSIKVVAQTAACIGREFRFSLLNAIMPMAPNTLALALSQLETNELIVAQGEPPQSVYRFKHALVRDAAYESQLNARRQSIHRDILTHLETEPTAPQVLAYHAGQAGLNERAVEYWTQAGDFAFEQPAYLEAINSYQRALNAMRGDAADLSDL